MIRYVKRGVKTGDNKVEILVMVTDKGTSPLLMKVMTLDDVPPGQVPTRTTPAVRAGSRRNTVAKTKAKNGMTKYWAQTPKNTSLGCFKTRTKSLALMVMPMPNMMMPKRTDKTEMPPTWPKTQEKLVGIVRPMMRKMMAMTPKNLPMRAQTCFIISPFSYHFYIQIK